MDAQISAQTTADLICMFLKTETVQQVCAMLLHVAEEQQDENAHTVAHLVMQAYTNNTGETLEADM